MAAHQPQEGSTPNGKGMDASVGLAGLCVMNCKTAPPSPSVCVWLPYHLLPPIASSRLAFDAQASYTPARA